MTEMVSSIDAHPCFEGEPVEVRQSEVLDESGDTLLMIQDRTGRILSLVWNQANHYGVDPGKVVSGLVPGFGPSEPGPYQERLLKVLNSLAPERFVGLFNCLGNSLLLDLVISPILLPDRSPEHVMVSGRLVTRSRSGNGTMGHAKVSEELSVEAGDLTQYPALVLTSDRYQRLLTQIAWNIRRTLDLPTIWQQTVNGLGRTFGVSRCIVCPYNHLNRKIKVVADYRQEPFRSMLDDELWIDNPALSEAISTLKPVRLADGASLTEGEREFEHSSVLVVATTHQDQPNGIIALFQYDCTRQWSDAELELMQDLASEVGTAIAHATLLAKSQSLTEELKKANSNLIQKHHELEDARQQAEEASRLKSEFLANTSHELRTPLNAMVGFLKLVIDKLVDNPQEEAEFIEEAYRAALHLNDILKDVLDLARIEAGRLMIEANPVRLDELLEDVDKYAQPQTRSKGLYFEIQKPATRDEIILHGDYQRLKQVMYNLVSNAVKFTHEGGITVSVEINRKRVTINNQELPGMVKVKVADTGIGVPLDKQDRLFQSFSQVDGSRTRQYGGTGLGLAISQKLVEAMGGVMNFYSMGEGLGSTVTFTIPLYQDPLMISS
jgi:signal transduction histidine kinase